MNKEESLSLAITVGAHIERNSCNSEMLTSFTEHELLAFANACEKIGTEKAAKICEEWRREYAIPQCCDEELASALEEISHKIRNQIQ